MERYSWTDGWHDVSRHFAYYVEDGILKRGMMDGRTVYPYVKSRYGDGLDKDDTLKACKRNYDKISWR